jgi:hypothetical protein
MISDIIASAPLLLPDGDICTLNVWYESVGSIHLISSSEVMLLPAVRWIDAGIVSDVSNELFLLSTARKVRTKTLLQV